MLREDGITGLFHPRSTEPLRRHALAGVQAPQTVASTESSKLLTYLQLLYPWSSPPHHKQQGRPKCKQTMTLLLQVEFSTLFGTISVAFDQHLPLHTSQTMIRESRYTVPGLSGWPATPGGCRTRGGMHTTGLRRPGKQEHS